MTAARKTSLDRTAVESAVCRRCKIRADCIPRLNSLLSFASWLGRIAFSRQACLLVNGKAFVGVQDCAKPEALGVTFSCYRRALYSRTFFILTPHDSPMQIRERKKVEQTPPLLRNFGTELRQS